MDDYYGNHSYPLAIPGLTASMDTFPSKNPDNSFHIHFGNWTTTEGDPFQQGPVMSGTQEEVDAAASE
jgi:hypothetical protein